MNKICNNKNMLCYQVMCHSILIVYLILVGSYGVLGNGIIEGDGVLMGSNVNRNNILDKGGSNGGNDGNIRHPTHVTTTTIAPAVTHSSHQQQQQHQGAGGNHLEKRNSYAMLSEVMSQAVNHEFSTVGTSSTDSACHADDLECYSGNIQDRLGMEAIRSLHRQLDDDDNGNIDLSESDDFLREELKYDSGYEKRQKAFHYNDDTHISVKELWQAWLRSEVHNWTVEQTTDWLAQSVQLPQYVELFKQHKVAGAALPRLAVNNMHYVSNVLGIKDPIHKQKIALKAMDVVLFGPPRETGTRWKDYILVTLLISAIIGCWYAYQQNKNAKRHLKRMAQDMEGLQKAEQALQEMQKELERARMEQENVFTEKLDLERRLKEAPSLSSSSSDLEVQQLKQEIEMLRSELSRAEVELVDHCWSPPPQLQSWLQYTYELESKNHLKKRISAEKQLQQAREACEKLRRKRSSLVGAFVSTHGKSIDDVDRSIVEARNSLNEVTNELQERLHRWKQIEMLLGFSIVNNNGISFLENILYNRNGSGKSSRGRLNNSTDDLDDESVQGMIVDPYNRNNHISGNYGSRDDSSGSDDGDSQSVQFFVGGSPATPLSAQHSLHSAPSLTNINAVVPVNTSAQVMSSTSASYSPQAHNNSCPVFSNTHENSSHNFNDENRNSPSICSERSERSEKSERSVQVPPRTKKHPTTSTLQLHQTGGSYGRAPLPPPRRANSHQSHIIRSRSTDTVPIEYYSFYPNVSTSHYQSTTAIIPEEANIASRFTTIQQGFSTGTTAIANTSAVAMPTSSTTATTATASSTSSSTTTITSATAHCDTQMEDTNSTDSSSFDDEFKKRRRKLHFPFGKKSHKSKLA